MVLEVRFASEVVNFGDLVLVHWKNIIIMKSIWQLINFISTSKFIFIPK